MASYRHHDPATDRGDERYRPPRRSRKPGVLVRKRLRDPRLAAERAQILGAQRLIYALERLATLRLGAQLP